MGLDSSVIPVSSFNQHRLNGIWAYNSGNPNYRGDLPHDSYLTSRIAWLGKINEDAHFCRALHTGKILNPENTELLYEEAPGSLDTLPLPVEGTIETYGYGADMQVLDGKKVVGHGGDGLSISAAYHSPEGNFTIAAAINVFNSYTDMADLFYSLYTLVDAYESGPESIHSANGQKTLNIYPNPAGDFITISLSEQELQNASPSILDMSGRTIRQFVHLETGTVRNAVQLSLLSDLREGYYLLRVNTGNAVFTKPFILAR